MIKALIFKFLSAFTSPAHLEKFETLDEAVDVLKPTIKLTSPTIMQKIERERPIQIEFMRFADEKLKENNEIIKKSTAIWGRSSAFPSLDEAFPTMSEWRKRHIK